MESIKCILCDSDDNFTSTITVSDRFCPSEKYTIQKCKCGMVLLNPRPDSKEIHKHYEKSNYDPQTRNSSLLSFFYGAAQIINNRNKRGLIYKYFKKGSLLDYGGGDGQFQAYMSKNYWDVDIYEPYLKHDSISEDLQDKTRNKYYDVVTMFHSLEHIHDIHNSLQNVKKVMKDQGILVIAVPNYDAYEKPFFKEDWIAYDAPRHLYHFDSNSIDRLLKKNGFELKESYPMYLDTFYNIIMSTNNKFRSIMKIIYLNFITLYNIYKDNKRASSMMLIYQKNEKI